MYSRRQLHKIPVSPSRCREPAGGRQLSKYDCTTYGAGKTTGTGVIMSDILMSLRQPLAQVFHPGRRESDAPARPVHYRHQLEKAALHLDVGYSAHHT